MYLPTFGVPELVTTESKFLHFRYAESQIRRLKTWYDLKMLINLGHRQKTTLQCPACRVLFFHMPVSQRYNHLGLTAWTASEGIKLPSEAREVTSDRGSKPTFSVHQQDKSFIAVIFLIQLAIGMARLMIFTEALNKILKHGEYMSHVVKLVMGNNSDSTL